MGFMDKAKQMAEQAQQKIDEAQKQFNDSQAQRAGQSQGAPGPPAGATPAAPVGGEGSGTEEAAPAAARTEPAPVKDGMNDSPDPFKPIE